MKILTCACCGSDVTCPQFFNGQVYGYTCIKKVCPTQKQTKVVFVAAELVSEKAVGPFVQVCVKVDGKKAFGMFSKATFAQVHTVQDGTMFVNPNAFK